MGEKVNLRLSQIDYYRSTIEVAVVDGEQKRLGQVAPMAMATIHLIRVALDC